MNILFVCGGLEPGKDGVGDYTGKLAEALSKYGIQCQLLSLNDKYISEIEESRWGGKIKTLRLPNGISWKTRIKRAKDLIDQFNPDFIMLQYVPFSFHHKGLPWKLKTRLKIIAGDRRWCIMFHELWVGIDKEAALKIKLWGLLQRYLIRRMLKEIDPIRIYTQSSLYKSILSDMGVFAQLLPLFSNIKPVYNNFEKDVSVFKCLLFGTVHHGAPVEDFVDEILNISKIYEKRLVFIFLGKTNNGLDEWISVLNRKKVKFVILGQLEEKLVSENIWQCDLGISTTPYFQVEKSGTVAAMREHGLPVLCVARDWTPVVNNNSPCIDWIIRYEKGRLLELINNSHSGKFEISSAKVSELLLKSLETIELTNNCENFS